MVNNSRRNARSNIMSQDRYTTPIICIKDHKYNDRTYKKGDISFMSDNPKEKVPKNWKITSISIPSTGFYGYKKSI